NSIDIFWIGDDPRVVHRAGIELVASFPTTAAIVRTKNATLPIGGLDRRINNVRINRRDCQADAAHLSRRQASPQLVPRRTRISRFVDGALWPAVNQGKHVATALIGSSENCFRIL